MERQLGAVLARPLLDEHAQESQRRATERQLGAVLEAAPDAMVVVDPRGNIVWVNAQAERLFGYARAGLLGKPVEVLVPPQRRDHHRAARAAYEAQPRARPMGAGLDLSGQRKDGSEFPVDVSLSPVQVDGNTLVISAIRDVTGRRQAQAEREQLLLREQVARSVAEGALLRERQARAETERALSVRDQVLAVVTHDLKNLVAALGGWIQYLQRQTGQSNVPEVGRLRKPLARLLRVTAQMHALIDDLLDSARLQQGTSLDLERRPTDLVRQAREAAGEFGQLFGEHHIHFTAGAPALVGTWDAARLDRVIANLLSNAIKYSPTGGDIDVAVTQEEAADGPVAVLIVRDHGVGIPAADVPHVFETFFRGRNVVGRIEGTGIGLRTVQQIVRQHGGTISVESAEGAGTTVTVRLPLAQATRIVA